MLSMRRAHGRALAGLAAVTACLLAFPFAAGASARGADAPATLAFVSTSTAHLASGSDRTLTVQIRDAHGNPITTGSYVVSFAKADGLGGVTGYGSATSVNGLASITVTGHFAGPLRLQASAQLNGAKTFAWISFTVVHGPLAKLAFYSPPRRPSPTSKIHVGGSRRMRIKLTDAVGNLVRNQPTSVQYSLQSGGGSLSGLPATVTTTNGRASVLIRGTHAGTVTLQAKGAGLTGTTTFDVVP